jgi:hypothetical protein
MGAFADYPADCRDLLGCQNMRARHDKVIATDINEAPYNAGSANV